MIFLYLVDDTVRLYPVIDSVSRSEVGSSGGLTVILNGRHLSRRSSTRLTLFQFVDSTIYLS